MTNQPRLVVGEDIRWRRAREPEWEYGTTLTNENGKIVDVRRLDGTEWMLWTDIVTVERVRR